MGEVDQILRGRFPLIHQDHEIGAAGDKCGALSEFGLQIERFLYSLGLVKHLRIIWNLRGSGLTISHWPKKSVIDDGFVF